ncbi:MAG: hypothetical protein WB992_15270 [Bryobacteraceae bacterium]
MATGNGDYGWREEMEQRMERLEKARKEIEDSVIVMAHLENEMSQMLRDQAKYVASHEARLRQQEERDRILDERIDKLVSAISEMIRRNPEIS